MICWVGAVCRQRAGVLGWLVVVGNFGGLVGTRHEKMTSSALKQDSRSRSRVNRREKARVADTTDTASLLHASLGLRGTYP